MKMTKCIVACVIGLTAIATQASAATTTTLQLVANDGSRWYEYFSDAYAELGRSHLTGGLPTAPVLTESVPGTNDGFFRISNESVQFGAANVFVNDNNFSNSYSVIFDSAITGTGLETRNITGFNMNFANDIADSDAFTNSGYLTQVTNAFGTVSFNNGILASIDGGSNIRFTYDASAFGLGLLDYDGSFVVSGNQWVLNVDDTNATGFGDLRYRWDVTGTVANVTAVPEPASFAVLGLAVTGFIARHRRRMRKSAMNGSSEA